MEIEFIEACNSEGEDWNYHALYLKAFYFDSSWAEVLKRWLTRLDCGEERVSFYWEIYGVKEPFTAILVLRTKYIRVAKIEEEKS